MRQVQDRWLRAGAVAVLVAVLGCTGDGAAPDPGEADGPAATAGTEGVATMSIGPEARLELEHALGHHAMLMIDAMRATADDSPRGAAAERALDRNSDTLSGLIADALDVSAGGFNDVWGARIDALLAASGGEDAGAALTDAHDDLAAFIAAATGQGMTEDEAATGLTDLDEQFTEQLEAYRDDDLATAFAAQREAFSTAIHLGEQLVLAAGAAPETTIGAAELRSAMQQLLGEHTWLATVTARRSARGAKDTRHAAAALNGNTEDLTAALLSVYDEQSAVAFDEEWRDAIAALLRFTAAATELDREARRAAADDLEAATRRLAEQLETITEETLSEQDAAEALSRHFGLLRRHSAAIADGRRRPASDVADEAYEASADLADVIAGAIAEHRADEFPAQ